MDIGAIRIDLQWSPPPEDIFSELSITGYRIRWSEFPLVTGARIEELFVSNVTYTSIRGLSPNTSYVFTISTLCEGAFPSSAANLPTDLYGARDPVKGFVVGDASNWTLPITTLSYDINFLFFDVQTLLSTNYTSSGNTSANTSTPLVINYGLSLVGSANIQNCNASSTCCDGFDATQGALMSCASNSISVCSVPSFSASRTFKYNGSMILLQSLPDFVSNFTSSSLPNVACGYAIRLTPSEARQSGAMWYRRKQNVGEGFDTIFTIQMSNPSQVCASMDDVNTLCRYRGADGMAFVIHNAAEIGPVDIGSLGTGGRGLGYEGIANGLVIEFDTHFNYDALDHYDNHISVITRVILIHPYHYYC